ncbi:MAG: hypothetical protein EXR86_11600 [Gammaproteobacteria bacterium]|nr:hypothetical protein [Gammaproteobacteria bacterium]
MKSIRHLHSPRYAMLGLLLTGGLVFNTSGLANEGRCAHKMHHGEGHFSAEKMRERMERRMTRLHDALTLSPEQAPVWSEFATAMKPPVDAPIPDFAALESLPAPERMSRQLEFMKAHHLRMESHIPVVTAFYGKLTPAQQTVFDREFMCFGRGHHPK